MNPIAMFKGWRDRRWCERWAKACGWRCVVEWDERCGRGPRWVCAGTAWGDASVIESPDCDSESAAWSALRRELEKH